MRNIIFLLIVILCVTACKKSNKCHTCSTSIWTATSYSPNNFYWKKIKDTAMCDAPASAIDSYRTENTQYGLETTCN